MLALSVLLTESADSTQLISVQHQAPGTVLDGVGFYDMVGVAYAYVDLPFGSLPVAEAFAVRLEIENFDVDRPLPAISTGLVQQSSLEVEFLLPNGGRRSLAVSQPNVEPYGPPWGVSVFGVTSDGVDYFGDGPALIPASGSVAVREAGSWVSCKLDGVEFASLSCQEPDPYPPGGTHQLGFRCVCKYKSGTYFPAHKGVVNIYVEPVGPSYEAFWTSHVGTKETE